MKYSLIIPTYNSEKTIEKCIKSILNQTYNNFEIIIVNDGSTDNTIEILKKFKDKRIKIINQKNHGVSFSRNTGIKECSGDYINFIDSDDFIKKNTLEEINKKLNDNKTIDILRYNFMYDNNNYSGISNDLYKFSNKLINICKIEDKEKLMHHFFTKYESIPTFSPLLFIKSNVCKKIKFDEKLSYLEDSDFYLSLVENSKNIYLLDKKNYIVTTSQNSASRNIFRRESNIYSILNLNEKWSKKYNFDKKLYIDICTTHAYAIGSMIPDVYLINKKEFSKKLKKIYNYSSFDTIFSNLDLSNLKLKDKHLISALRKKKVIQVKILLNIILIYRKWKKRG